MSRSWVEWVAVVVAVRGPGSTRSPRPRASSSSSGTETVLYARDRRWLPALEGYLTGEGAFAAVGAGHLLGDQGLRALLAGAGHRVERAR